MNQEDPNIKRPPSVDRLLKETQTSSIPRLLRKRLIQDLLHQWRQGEMEPATSSVEERIQSHLKTFEKHKLTSTINATGIVLHTNLGRAPFDQDLPRHLINQITGYNNLEFDLSSGKRGKRGIYVEKALAVLSGSESATVVNNCAAALILILNTCKSKTRREVLVSRSELVQIGGGFRIPEILESAGLQLKEIGTTNRTHLDDYKKSISEETALILKVHQSNFYMEGFVESVSVPELAQLARDKNLPLAVDLGSGALIDTKSRFSIDEETTPANIIQQGADMVCYSGDKLMAGPQAGIIAGKADWIRRLKSNPFFRALRPDKLALCALEFTVQKHLESTNDPESKALPDLPAYFLLNQTTDELRKRAENIKRTATSNEASLKVVETVSEIGGGTMPRTRMESIALVMNWPHVKPDLLARCFRELQPPILGYVHQGNFHLNLRTVFPDQDETLSAHIRQVEEKLTQMPSGKS